MTFRTRFAPSPTGPLHLGHAYSAILAHDMAKAAEGEFLLRIENTDRARSKPEWEDLIYEDLAWLGLSWRTPVLRQSDHAARYSAVMDELAARGLVYPCRCTRSDIRAALSAPQEGDAPLVYPGTCRSRAYTERRDNDALRLNLDAALAHISQPLDFTETGPQGLPEQTDGPHYLRHEVGDVMLGRKEGHTVAYVLAGTLDDAYEGITHVIRGQDLTFFTYVQVLLQKLLDLPSPIFHHHKLIRDDKGKRLAKRDDARAISKFRADGYSPQEIRQLVGL